MIPAMSQVARLSAARFSCDVLPRVRKERVPGANFRARLRRGQPGGERFLRHPGFRFQRKIATRDGCEENVWTALS
jgi:hypothetical protein